MKNKYKTLLNGLLVSFFLIASVTAFGQATITATPTTPTTGLTAGALVDIDVYALIPTLGNLGSFNFLFIYNRDVLTCNSIIYKNPGLAAGGWSTLNANYKPVFWPDTTAKVTWTYTQQPLGLPCTSSTLLFTLRFTFNGGSTQALPITFYQTNTTNGTRLAAPPGTYYYSATYISNIAVSGNTTTLHSVSGGGDWKTASTWTEGVTPTRGYDVVITGSQVTDTIAGGTAKTGKCNNLTINAGGKLTVASGKKLQVANNLYIKDRISIGDPTAAGSFIDLGTTTVTGTTTVERFMTGNWNTQWPANSDVIWHYISSPVSGGTINSFLAGLLNYWDEPTTLWIPMTTPVSTPLAVNKGYSAAIMANSTINYTGGTVNTGDRVINGLTNGGPAGVVGFNLIGNSFPSAVKWDANIVKSGIDATAYFWTGSTYIQKLTSDPVAYEIPAGQGFFVHVTAQGTGGLTIPNTNRVHSSGNFVKSSAPEQLELKVKGNNLEDATSIRFNPSATTGFDPEYDAYKLWGINACPQIYSIATDNLSINSLPDYISTTVIPVGFKLSVSGSYSITASGLETFPTGTDIYLEDLFLNKTQNLTINPVYEFIAAPTNENHRFDIHFAPTTGARETAAAGNIKIYSYDNNVYVNVPFELNGEIMVYDLLGKVVNQKPVEGNSLNKISMNVQSGIYVVKVLGDKSTASGKVFIR